MASILYKGGGGVSSASIPSVVAFSPTQGAIGNEITIYGEGFTGATAVNINSVAVDSFTVVSDGIITATIATGTTTGKVSVTNATSTGESLADFIVITLSAFSKNNLLYTQFWL